MKNQVIISVRGGCADVEYKSDDVEVLIRDYDNEPDLDDHDPLNTCAICGAPGATSEMVSSYVGTVHQDCGAEAEEGGGVIF